MHVWPAPCAEGPPSSTALSRLVTVCEPSQAPAPHPLPPTAHRPPFTSLLHRPCPRPPPPRRAPITQASPAPQRSAPHLTASPSTAPPGPSPRPVLTPRPSLPSSARRGRHPSGQSRFVSDKAAAVDAESHGQLPASAARPRRRAAPQRPLGGSWLSWAEPSSSSSSSSEHHGLQQQQQQQQQQHVQVPRGLGRRRRVRAHRVAAARPDPRRVRELAHQLRPAEHRAHADHLHAQQRQPHQPDGADCRLERRAGGRLCVGHWARAVLRHLCRRGHHGRCAGVAAARRAQGDGRGQCWPPPDHTQGRLRHQGQAERAC